jgi:hypothetical protein
MNVWVYSLKDINNLNDYLIPYFNEYVVPYSSKYKTNEFGKFVYILNKLKEKPKFDNKEFIDIINIWFKYY